MLTQEAKQDRFAEMRERMKAAEDRSAARKAAALEALEDAKFGRRPGGRQARPRSSFYFGEVYAPNFLRELARAKLIQRGESCRTLAKPTEYRRSRQA